MPSVIDPETIQVDSLPALWSPIQSALTDDERARELEAQATASLLWAADVPGDDPASAAQRDCASPAPSTRRRPTILPSRASGIPNW